MQICNDLTSGDLDARGAYLTQMKKKTRKNRFDNFKNSFLKKVEGIKDKDINPKTRIKQQYQPYEKEEIERQREAHRKSRTMKRKKPSFEYFQPKEEQIIDTIIKKRNIRDKTILKLWEKLKKIDEVFHYYNLGSSPLRAPSLPRGHHFTLVDITSPVI